MTIGNFISFITDVISIFILLGGILSFIFKNFIKEWIAAKFKSQLQKENEDYKQKFLRELETYKAVLVKELEEYKLTIDLKRNISLKYSDKKLEAYEIISSSYGKIIEDILSYSMVDIKYRESYSDYKIKMLDRIGEINNSLSKYKFYIEVLSVGIRLANIYSDLVHLFKTDNLADANEIEIVLKKFSDIHTLMKEELLGIDHIQKYATPENKEYLINHMNSD